jgi:hypothetical protein
MSNVNELRAALDRACVRKASGGTGVRSSSSQAPQRRKVTRKAPREDGVIVMNADQRYSLQVLIAPGGEVTADDIEKATWAVMPGGDREVRSLDGGEVLGELVELAALPESFFKQAGLDYPEGTLVVGVVWSDDDAWAEVEAGRTPAFRLGK